MDTNTFYIDGTWVPNAGPTITVENPATRATLGVVPAGTADEANAAVAAARRAFPAWAATTRAERARLLAALREALIAKQEEIGALSTAEVGTPLRISRRMQGGLPVSDVATVVDLLAQEPVDEMVGNSLVVKEPVGVVVAITPWNYPVHQVMTKLAPALAAGCTVVVKPSEAAPLSVHLLFEAIDEVGFPPGVVNLVDGYGAQVGQALVAHPDVDAVTFTGSVASGASVAETAARTIKRVTLELGGKSANVILDDADLPTAVKVGVANAFLNAGQTCNAWTRMIVPAQRQDEVLELARGFAQGYVAGDPLDGATKLGPLVNAAQRDRVRGYIAQGIAEGARLVAGGLEAPVVEGDCADGLYVAATVFGDVDPDSVIAQEEIFGPVLAVIPYTDEAQALAIANNSAYGLHGAVWSGDQERAVAFARGMRTGQVDVNGGAFNPLAPFGGYKRSGVGREYGQAGIDEFLETKAIQL